MRFRVKLVVFASFTVLALGGCVEGGAVGGGPQTAALSSSSTQTVSISRGKTAEERSLEREVRDLNQITRNIIVSNTIQGAVAGAVAGCVIGELASGACGEGAIAGALTGGLFGNAVGRQAAQKKRELVAADQTLEKLRGVQAQLTGVEQNLRAVLNRQNSEIASLRRQVSAGQVSASAARSRINAINDNRANVIRGLDASRENVSEEQAKLVRLEQESGENLRSTRRAVSSTSNRIQALRNTVRLVPT